MKILKRNTFECNEIRPSKRKHGWSKRKIQNKICSDAWAKNRKIHEQMASSSYILKIQLFHFSNINISHSVCSKTFCFFQHFFLYSFFWLLLFLLFLSIYSTVFFHYFGIIYRAGMVLVNCYWVPTVAK